MRILNVGIAAALSCLFISKSFATDWRDGLRTGEIYAGASFGESISGCQYQCATTVCNPKCGNPQPSKILGAYSYLITGQNPGQLYISATNGVFRNVPIDNESGTFYVKEKFNKSNWYKGYIKDGLLYLQWEGTGGGGSASEATSCDGSTLIH